MEKDNLKKDCERKAREILIEGHGCKKDSEDCHHGHCGSWGKCEILQGLIEEALLSEHLIVQKDDSEYSDDLGAETLDHIKTMYPDIWKNFSQSSKASVKNFINNRCLIVQKRVEELEKELARLNDIKPIIEGLRSGMAKGSITVDKSAVKIVFDKEFRQMQKQIDELNQEVNRLRASTYPIASETIELNKKYEILQTQSEAKDIKIDELKKLIPTEAQQKEDFDFLKGLHDKIDELNKDMQTLTQERDIEIKRAREAEMKVEELAEKTVIMECQCLPCSSALSEKIGRLVIKEAEAQEKIDELKKEKGKVCEWCGSNDLVCGKAWKEEREKLTSKIDELTKENEAKQDILNGELQENLLLFSHLGIDRNRIGNEAGVTGVKLVNKAIDDLIKENVVLREALEVTNASHDEKLSLRFPTSIPKGQEWKKEIGESNQKILNSISEPVKRLEAKLEAGREAAEALRQLYSELVESNSPRCDEWSTPANIIKQALQKLREAGVIK